MYNHYLQPGQFVPIEPEPEPTPPGEKKADPETTSLPRGEGGILKQLFGGLAGRLKPERFDTGDILLILIILFLFLEGDNLDVVITLGLMLLLGLSED